MWAQCDHTFQFLKKSQISQFSCEISPLLMLTINAHHACLSTLRRHRGKLAGEDGHQGAVPSSPGPENDGTEETKSQLKRVCKSHVFPYKTRPSWLAKGALRDQSQPQSPGYTGLEHCEREDPNRQERGRNLGSHSRDVPIDTRLGGGSQAGPGKKGPCVVGSRPGRRVTPGSKPSWRRDSNWQWALTANLIQDGEVCLVFCIGKGE